MTELNVILAALAAALVGLIATAAAVLKRYITRRGEIAIHRLEQLEREPRTVRERYSDGFVRMAKFYDQIERVKRIVSVERVLVFTGSNHGGFPDPSKEYRVLCLHGWAQDPTKDPEAAYNFKMIVDKTYCLMLAEMLQKGKSVQTLDEMPECLLKKYYRIEGVKQSIIYFLSVDEAQNEILFASFASYARIFTTTEVEVMDVCVDRMRAILRGDDTNEHLRPRPADDHKS